jgi:DNA-binding MarR family transcriptional regulator
MIDSINETLLICDPCLCVQRAARVLARRFDKELRRIGLTNGQFILLLLLNCPEPPGMPDLASLLAMDGTTLAAALKLLERRDLVKIKPDATD